MEQNWTYDELEGIQTLMERSRYSHAELLRAFDLYNRVFNKTKSITSCGKCNSNVFKALRRKYEEERIKRG
jgi:hypothetical protein